MHHPSRFRLRGGHRNGLLHACFALLAAVALWSSSAMAQTSTLCPNLNATVAYGGSVGINAGSCHAGFGLGNVATQATHGIGSVGAFGPNQQILYTHNGSSGTTDFFVVRDGNAPPNNLIRVNITITPPTSAIVVAPAVLPAMTAGSPFDQVLTASGGVAPYSFTLGSGTLPAGLSLSSSGRLSGTPTQRGAYAFSIRAQDAIGDFIVKGYSGTVQNPSLSLSPGSATAVQGQAFSHTLSTSGGLAPYSYRLETGTVPAGLILSSGGVFSGTTSVAPGNYPMTLRVTDASGGPGSYFEIEPFTIVVQSPPAMTIAPVTIAPMQVGVASSVTFTASGGSAPYRFAVTAGALPAGLALAGDTLSGTPTASGSFIVAITATDNNDDTVVGNYTISISAPTLTLTPAAGTLSATAGVAFSQHFVAGGGTPAYAYAISAGALPPGLSLDPGTGLLSGTPSASGLYAFSVRARDNSTGTGAPFARTQNYVMQVAAPTLVITPATLPAATRGVPYNQILTTTGGTAPYGYQFVSGGIPPGITFISTGVIIGTPSTMGSYVMRVRVTDSGGNSLEHDLAITIQPATITLGPAPPDGAVGVAYNASLSASGSTGPYTFTVTSGALPTGLTLSPQGELSGTPTSAGTFNLQVEATDTFGNVGSANHSMTIAMPTLTLAPAAGTLNATAGVAFSQQFVAGGGTPAYAYAISAGALPPGLSLDPATGLLSGTPTTAGFHVFSVSVRDSSTGSGAPFVQMQGYVMQVAAPALVITPATLPTATRGVPYRQSLVTSGGIAPYRYDVVSGTVPSGLTVVSTGLIAGTPSTKGSYISRIRVTDAGGNSLEQNLVITVQSATITLGPAPPVGTVGMAYNTSLSASGGTGPYAFSVTSGALPAGMTLSPQGVLSGVPTAAGTFNLQVNATDTTGDAGTANYRMTIAAPTLLISPASLPAGTGGVAYQQTLDVTGGIAPYRYALVGGALPAGIALGTDGVVSGTPTVAGDFSARIRVTDDAGFTAESDVALSITSPVIAIDVDSLPDAVVDGSFRHVLAASGGSAPYAFSISGGALPAGLKLAADGTLSGTPTVAGNASFTVTATDAHGFIGVAAMTLVVDSAPPRPMDDSATVVAGTPLRIAVTDNDNGAITAIDIVTAPRHGSAEVDGLAVVYTAAADFSGTDTLRYVATGPGGTSAPATLTIIVNAVPVAVSRSVDVIAGQAVEVELTEGASGGPFTAATLLGLTPAQAGTASITRSGSGADARYLLKFSADAAFSGEASARYTLDNAHASSAVAIITFQVAPRPDPTRDPEVRALIDAQAAATRRFAGAQITNFQQRLERLHGSGASGFDNRLGFAIDNRGCQPTPGQAGGRLGNLAGDGGIGASCSRTGAQDDRSGRMTGAPGDDGNQPATDPATRTPSGDGGNGGLAFWLGGTLRSGAQQGRNGSADTDFESDGLSIGADYRLSDAFALGAGVGWGRDASDLGDHDSRSEGTAYTLALYASYHPGTRLFVDTLLGYQSLSYDLRRHVTETGGRVDGSRDGRQWFGSISVGADWQRSADLQLTPYARLDVARARLDGYREHGDDLYALRHDAMDVDTTTGNIGLRIDIRRKQAWGEFSPQLRVEYQHDFQGNGVATMDYADLPGSSSYRTPLSDFDRRRIMLGVGAAFRIDSGLRTRIEYRGLLGNGGDRDHGLQFSLEKSY